LSAPGPSGSFAALVQDPKRARTWVVIAAHKEGSVIRSVVSGVAAEGWSVAIVDDGSPDDTSAAARVPGVHVLRHAINLGQGAALQTGTYYALAHGAENVVTVDADGQHRTEDISLLVAALREADVALGSRFLGTMVGVEPRRRRLLRLATKVSNRLSGMQLTDAHCGLHAFRASVAPRLRITQERMAHASEFLRKVKLSGVRVVEVPVTVAYTEYSMRKDQSGFQAVRILFDYFFHR
jgi:glycosyltransferase involved in cell wall biosynthesis